MLMIDAENDDLATLLEVKLVDHFCQLVEERYATT